jgi:hypothetical protein
LEAANFPVANVDGDADGVGEKLVKIIDRIRDGGREPCGRIGDA